MEPLAGEPEQEAVILANENFVLEVNEMNTTRYSLSQVLCGLREVFKNEIGSSDDFHFDTEITGYITAQDLEEIDFFDIL